MSIMSIEVVNYIDRVNRDRNSCLSGSQVILIWITDYLIPIANRLIPIVDHLVYDRKSLIEDPSL